MNNGQVSASEVCKVADPACWAVTGGAELWRQRVTRLSLVVLSGSDKPEEFYERACASCGGRVMVDPDIYPRGEPFACGDSLYGPSGSRDGYWYAIALAGQDPDGASTGVTSWWRKRRLVRACWSVGLRVKA